MQTIVYTESYRTRRAADYPDIGDQLDELWRLLAAHPAIANAVANSPVFQSIQSVKAKYPVPSAGTPIANGPSPKAPPPPLVRKIRK
jgi:hypothetical protein